MVISCFPFFNELELLEIRLIELWDVVDLFVLAEGTVTHSGKPKPLYYADNRNRFSQWEDKIRHVVVEDWPDPSPWGRESWQKRALARGLPELKDEDILIIEDADEIPRCDIVSRYRPEMGNAKIGHDVFYYYLNSRRVQPGLDSQGVIVCWKAIKDRYIDRPSYWTWGMQPPYPDKVQDSVYSAPRSLPTTQVIPNAGWHFSYIGGVERVQQKLDAFAHQELLSYRDRPAHLRLSMKTGADLFQRQWQFAAVPIDATFPKALRTNPERYKHLLADIPTNRKVAL